ncbi:hypothetical protein H4R34_005534, partial [Dimargaris verticillata]
MLRPNRPFYQARTHVTTVRCLYRRLLRLSGQFTDDVHRCYLKSWIRERFRYFRFLKSPMQVQRQIAEGDEVEQRLTRALADDTSELKFIDDLAYGRLGRLYDVINWIKSYDNP